MSDSGYRQQQRSERRQDRSPSKEAREAHHASMQQLREGNADFGRDHAEAFTDLDDIGIQNDEIAESDLLEPFETEASLDDPDTLDESPLTPSPLPGGLVSSYIIRCFEDHAIFQAPSWSLGWLPKEVAQEHSKRWQAYSRIAGWLTTHRRRFLREPTRFNFWDSTDLTNGYQPPVTCEGLHQATGCENICDATTFNRHVREAALVWNTKHIPIAELFSRESKIAWCAAAVIARRQRHPFSLRLLPTGIQTPRPQSAEGRRLLEQRRSPELLTPEKYVQLVCLIAGVAWSSVTGAYAKQMFPEAS